MKKEEVERILKPVAERYRIEFAPDELIIHTPSFTHIPYEKIEKIEERDATFEIKTPISSILLFKNVLSLHETIHWKEIQEAIKAKEELGKKKLSEVVEVVEVF
jgi:hypothetical protein